MITNPRLYRVAAADGTRIFGVEGLEFEGRLWIVTEWRESPDEGYRMPERMICIDDLPHQSFPPDNELGIDFAVNTAIPPTILDGTDAEPQASGYVVMRSPPIRVALETAVAEVDETAKTDGPTDPDAR